MLVALLDVLFVLLDVALVAFLDVLFGVAKVALLEMCSWMCGPVLSIVSALGCGASCPLGCASTPNFCLDEHFSFFLTRP